MRSRILRFPRARILALAVGVGALGSLAAAPGALALTVSHVPLVGTNCAADGKISGAGSTFQAGAFSTGFTYGYEQDVCGAAPVASNLNAAYPSDPTFYTATLKNGTSGKTTVNVQGMVSYNYALSGTSATNGSGAGLNRISCRTDLFAGTDLPYSDTQLSQINGAPGTEDPNGTGPACGNLNTGSVPAPFGPLPPGGSYPPAADATANAMSFPVAGGAVAFSANLNGACPAPTVSFPAPQTQLQLAATELDQIWQGKIKAWNDPSLQTTNPGTGTESTTVSGAQGLPQNTTVNYGPQTATTTGTQSLSTALTTLNVSSTTGFPTSGEITVVTTPSGKPAITETLAYTGTTATSFTGISAPPGFGSLPSTGSALPIAAGAAVALEYVPVASGGVLDVASTAGFSSTGGTIEIGTTTGTQTLTYTGVGTDTNGSPDLTGVSAGTGNVLVGGAGAQSPATVDSVGTLNVASTTGFPTSGSLTVTNGTTTEELRYTGTTATSFTGVTTASSAFALAGGETVAPASPLAGCNLNPIQRVVRQDNSGTTGLTMQVLGAGDGGTRGIDTAAISCASGSPTWLTEFQTAGANTVWPSGCGGPNTVNADSSGTPALVTLEEQTAGGIGYGELGLWAANNPAPVAGNVFAALESASSTSTNGITDINPAVGFVSPGAAGGASSCNDGVQGLPNTSSSTDAVGLSGAGKNWSNSGTTPSTDKQNITWLGTGYPDCGLTFDLVYTGMHNETGENAAPANATPAGTPGCTATQQTNSGGSAQTFPLSGNTLNVASTTGFPPNGVITVPTSTTTFATLQYSGTTATSFTGISAISGGSGTIAATSVVGLITGSCQAVQGPFQGTTNDQLRTLYSYFTYVFSPLGQSYIDQATYDELPASWLTALRQGWQGNY